METFEDIVEETLEIIRENELSILNLYLTHLEVYIMWAFNPGSDVETPTVDWSLHKVVRGALELFGEVLKQLTPDERSVLAHGTGQIITPNKSHLFSPLDLVLRAGRVVAVKDRLVSKVVAENLPGVPQPVVRITWDGSIEKEYREYLNATAIDNEYSKWFVYCIHEVTSNREYKDELNDVVKGEFGVTADELFTCLKLLELMNDEYWNPSSSLLDMKEKENEPLWRWSYEKVERKLTEKLSSIGAKRVLNLLSWKPEFDLYKHPLVPDNKGNFMFAHWFWSLDPNPPKMWLYPYYYYGHWLAGKAGELRGKTFENYLKDKVLSISEEFSIVPNREYHSQTHRGVRDVQLDKIEIDLAIRYDKTGLVVDAKGGVEELPKRIEDCLWNDISSDDVYHRLEDNMGNAEKWDKVVTAVRKSDEIIQDLGLDEYETIIPVIVHSKVQPIMIGGYVQKYGRIFETQTHSIQTFHGILEKLILSDTR